MPFIFKEALGMFKSKKKLAPKMSNVKLIDTVLYL